MLHEAAFTASLVVGALLIASSDGGAEHAAAAVFAGSVAACFGLSALYHRGRWTAGVQRWLRRLDHAGIYLLIVGTYTPVCILALDGAARYAVLAVVCVAAVAAIVFKFVRMDAANWLAAATGIALGWIGVALLPQLVTQVEPAAIALLGAGGIAYTAGAIVYACRRPNPLPTVFGYHEVFHALTVCGAACQYVAIAFFVVRAG